MPGFTKLFSHIISSTIWLEPDRTRIVWVTMMAMADRKGRVFASVPGLAKDAVVPVEDARKAIETLLAPDPDSRSKEFDGRRIEAIDGGWQLLNYKKYREKREEDERREYLRLQKQEERSRATTGYVYYAQVGNYIKIGFSANPWARVSEMRTVSPTISLVAIERGTMQTEKTRHERFSYLRQQREWFVLDQALLDHIKSLHDEKWNESDHPLNTPEKVVSVVPSVVNIFATRSNSSELRQPIAEAEAEADIKPIAPTRFKTNRSEPTLFPDNHASVFDLGPLNDGSFFPIPQELCDQYVKSYPAVNVEQQFREMNAWLISNPKERKTRRGVPRFMNAWLAREQDKTPLPKPVRRAEFDREAWLKSRESE